MARGELLLIEEVGAVQRAIDCNHGLEDRTRLQKVGNFRATRRISHTAIVTVKKTIQIGHVPSGRWPSTFIPSLTQAAPFTLSDRTEISCQMMHKTSTFPYFSGSNFQAVELPYGQTRRLRMLIILPAVGVNLKSFVANMTSDELSDWIADLKPAHVEIGMPRFTATYEGSLDSALTSLGMGAAFDANLADFSGVASRTRVYVSDIEHETVVKVDESGTVAAGATAAELVLQRLPIGVIMNRPFFYAIVDGKTGALLFIGTLINPIQTSS